jgi:TIR domain-containing protein
VWGAAVAQIFISYRRDDAGGYAGRLEDGLERVFGVGSAFRDVADLRPGDDYFQVLTQRIASAVAVLVVIGPRWLTAEREGQPRLERHDDVVRQEVRAALASGKPVIPVLVGGATMPEASMLPPSLAPLARFQAVSLSETGWEGDLTGLARVLAPLLAHPRAPGQRSRLAAALAVMLILGGVGGWWWWKQRPDPAGTWRAEVTYDWGDRYKEQFVFERFAGQWRGTASFLGYPRPITRLEVSGRTLHFETRSMTSMGGETREQTHRYAGELDDDQLRLVLTTEGDFVSHAPLRFTATRAKPGP